MKRLPMSNSFLKEIVLGLPNPSNNCWFNAVITMLIHTFGAFCSLHSNTLLLESLHPLLNNLTICRSLSALSLSQLNTSLNFLCSDNSVFTLGQQQDAHEFFVCLLSNLLYEDYENKNIAENLKWNDFFDIEINQTVHCLACSGYCSERVDTEKQLSLAIGIEKNGSVQEIVDNFFSDEKLNDFVCDHCKNTSSSSIRRRISKLPKTLAISVKRFDNTVKNRQAIYPSSVLALQKHLGETESTVEPSFYSLRSIVVHKGLEKKSGHYTSVLMLGGSV